jgi:hypothetical protein
MPAITIEMKFHLIEGQYQRAIQILTEKRQINATGRYFIRERSNFKDDLEPFS